MVTGGKKRRLENSTLAGMLDRTRVMMCAIMFTVMLFNPFGNILTAAVPSAGDVSRSSGRTLLSMNPSGKLMNACQLLFLNKL